MPIRGKLTRSPVRDLWCVPGTIMSCRPQRRKGLEMAKKKLAVKDLAGKKLSKEQSTKVKGGAPRITCLSGRRMG